MAAKPPHVLLIDCPPSRNDGGGGGCWRRHQRACRLAALVLAVAAVIAGIINLAIFLYRGEDESLPSKPAVYTVAITGVSGLDVLSPPPPPLSPSPAADGGDAASDDYYYSPPALSPVFDLTFQIDNTQNAYYEACVPGLSRADVSYGDAFLAGGSVPPFCAGKMGTSTAAARAWGENVAVPRFLRDQLAAELGWGDASVDVKVTMPAGAVLSCKPKIGDGTYAACRLDHLY